MSSSEFHSDFKALLVSTHEVGVTGLKLQRSISPEALSALLKEKVEEFSWQAKESSLINFELECESEHAFKVKLSAQLMLNCACVRCLKPVVHKVPLDLTIRMIEGEGEKLSEDLFFDSDAVTDDGDFPVGYFSHRSIDLGAILREQIFLEVPDYPHCGGEIALVKTACASPFTKVEKGPERDNPFVKLFKNNLGE